MYFGCEVVSDESIVVRYTKLDISYHTYPIHLSAHFEPHSRCSCHSQWRWRTLRTERWALSAFKLRGRYRWQWILHSGVWTARRDAWPGRGTADGITRRGEPSSEYYLETWKKYLTFFQVKSDRPLSFDCFFGSTRLRQNSILPSHSKKKFPRVWLSCAIFVGASFTSHARRGTW